MAKAKIKIVSISKEFSKEDLDCFRRMLNVLEHHNLVAELQIKETKSYKLDKTKLKIV